MGEYAMPFTGLRKPLLALIAIGVLSAGCGGGGGSATPSPSGPVSVLSWNPPAVYADNVMLDTYRELDHYELYVRKDNNFNDTDAPVAVIAAVVDSLSSGGSTGGPVLEKEFILENVQPFIDTASRHYVTLKAVGIDGQKSGFMSPVVWDKI